MIEKGYIAFLVIQIAECCKKRITQNEQKQIVRVQETHKCGGKYAKKRKIEHGCISDNIAGVCDNRFVYSKKSVVISA